MSEPTTANEAGRYEIRLKGHLDSRWAAWFDGMTLNSYQPPAVAQASRGSAVTFVFPPLRAGGHMTVWLEWSVNPTNLAWQRPESLVLDDGPTRLLGVHPDVTVFP